MASKRSFFLGRLVYFSTQLSYRKPFLFFQPLGCKLAKKNLPCGFIDYQLCFVSLLDIILLYCIRIIDCPWHTNIYQGFII